MRMADTFAINNFRLITSEATNVDDAYFAALAESEDLSRTRGIDATLKKFNLDAILLPIEGQVLDPKSS